MDHNGFIQRHGLATNTHGRAYKNGAALSFAEKMSIDSEYVKCGCTWMTSCLMAWCVDMYVSLGALDEYDSGTGVGLRQE